MSNITAQEVAAIEASHGVNSPEAIMARDKFADNEAGTRSTRRSNLQLPLGLRRKVEERGKQSWERYKQALAGGVDRAMSQNKFAGMAVAGISAILGAFRGAARLTKRIYNRVRINPLVNELRDSYRDSGVDHRTFNIMPWTWSSVLRNG